MPEDQSIFHWPSLEDLPDHLIEHHDYTEPQALYIGEEQRKNEHSFMHTPLLQGHANHKHSDMMAAGGIIGIAGVAPASLARGGVVSMTRQHFEFIAEVISHLGSARREVAEKFADALESTNPAFDRERFLNAAEGMQEGGVVDDEDLDESNAKYAVVENMPGYLPESEPAYFATEQDAEDYAKELEESLEEGSPYVVDIIELKKGALVQKFKMKEGAVVGTEAYYLSDEYDSEAGPFCWCGHNEGAHYDGLCHACAEAPEEFEGDPHHDFEVAAHEGIATVENIGPGVPAIIGEAGPEAVIPLDDPNAVDAMADAIEEGGAGGEEQATEAVADAAEEIAAASVEVAEASAEVAEAAADIVENVTEASEENVEEVADVAETVAEESADIVESAETAETVQEAVRSDVPPRAKHWSQRPIPIGRGRR